MRLNFSIKLFSIFLFFSLILFLILISFEYTVIENKLERNSKKEFVYNYEILDKKLENLKIQSQNIIDSVLKLNSLKNFDKSSLENSINSIIYSHTNLLEVSVLDENMNYLIDVQKDKDKEKRDLNFAFLSKIDTNRFYFSQIDLSIKNKEIQIPLIQTLKAAKKTNHYLIVIHMNINKLVTSDYFFFILENNKNILYDKTGKYSWSKYYYPTLKIENIFPFPLEKNRYKKTTFENGYIFRSLNFDENLFLTLIGKTDNLNFQKFLKDNTDEILIIALVSFLISFILSVLFSVPLSNINQKLNIQKNILLDSIKKKEIQLDDTLEIINQNVMYLKIDKDFIIEDVSSYFCKIYGYEKEELIGQHYSILYSKEIYAEIQNEILKKLLKEKKWSGEVLSRKKTGEDYWVKSDVKVNSEDGKIQFFTVIRKDISDNKKVEKLYEDLYYQIEQQNIIFQNVYSGIALINLKGEIKKANLAFCKIFEFKEKEMIFRNLLFLVDKESKEFLKKVLDEVKELGFVKNVEFIFLTKSAKEIYLELSLKILPDRKNIVLAVNSLEDKRKLQELNLNLEQKVKDEVRKNIEKDKVHQEEKLKNVKLTSIGTLAAGITHEINTPLTYLKGNFEMLQMDIDDVDDENLKKEMNESCTKISDAINRISVIVESMREMSQSSSEAKEKTNIFATLITSLTMAYNISKQICKIKLNQKEFKLTNIKKDDFEIFAKVQKQRIEQVWIIIINNALDELKKIETYEKRDLDIDIFEEQNEVVVRFSDNAGGIKQEILPKIFEPFTSSKEHSGMGIGLNIAKKIIDEQEGKIKAYNSKNGAVFEVRLKFSK